MPAVEDRLEHGAPDLDEEGLAHRAEREERLVREDAGETGGPVSFDRDAVPDAEE